MGFFSIIKNLFSSSSLYDDSFFENFEDKLIEADLGSKLSFEIIEEFKKIVKKTKISNDDEIKNILKNILSKYIEAQELTVDTDKLNIFLVLGINGVGKTTSISKMVNFYKNKGIDKIVLGAGDTFRAAAIEQLKIHASRNNVRIVAQQDGSDPGAVIFDTIESAKSKNETLVIADTAGRMHNKVNLIKELQKIDKIIKSKMDSNSIYKKILVIDCMTGQNALSQAEIFNEAIGLDGFILSKFDSSSRGGIAINISNKLKLPFYFFGTGEGLEDLHVFDKEHFFNKLLED